MIKIGQNILCSKLSDKNKVLQYFVFYQIMYYTVYFIYVRLVSTRFCFSFVAKHDLTKHGPLKVVMILCPIRHIV